MEAKLALDDFLRIDKLCNSKSSVIEDEYLKKDTELNEELKSINKFKKIEMKEIDNKYNSEIEKIKKSISENSNIKTANINKLKKDLDLYKYLDLVYESLNGLILDKDIQVTYDYLITCEGQQYHSNGTSSKSYDPEEDTDLDDLCLSEIYDQYKKEGFKGLDEIFRLENYEFTGDDCIEYRFTNDYKDDDGFGFHYIRELTLNIRIKHLDLVSFINNLK